MKILFIHDSPFLFGGAELVLREEIELLTKRGHEVYLFSIARHNDEAKLPHNIRLFIESKYKVVRGLGLMFFSKNLIILLKKTVASINPDVIHVHNNYSYTVSILLGIPDDLPVVQTVHDCGLFCASVWGINKKSGIECNCNYGIASVVGGCYPWWRYLLFIFRNRVMTNLIKRKVDLFISPSKYLMRRLEDNGYSPVTHLPGYSSIAPSKQALNRETLVYIGRLSQEKGIKYLIESLSILNNRSLNLAVEIIGTGKEECSLRDYVTKLGLSNQVFFRGDIRHSKLVKYFEKASILIYPSIWGENCPLAILEAMRFGIPVVASNIGGIPELVRDGNTGLLFEPRNSNDLANKISRLLSHPLLLNRMGRNARGIYQDHYSQEIHYKRLMKIYHKTIYER